MKTTGCARKLQMETYLSRKTTPSMQAPNSTMQERSTALVKERRVRGCSVLRYRGWGRWGGALASWPQAPVGQGPFCTPSHPEHVLSPASSAHPPGALSSITEQGPGVVETPGLVLDHQGSAGGPR